MNEIRTDKKSKVILWVFLIAVAVSAFFMYDRYIMNKDFEIFMNEDGSLPQPEE